MTVLRPGSFAAAHPYAPYYVVPRKRFTRPVEAHDASRATSCVSKPESTLSKGALAGSPQIVRLSLRATSGEPVKVEGVGYTVVSDARPLRGWYTALPGCEIEPVRCAKLNLDRRRAAVRYVGADKRSSRTLGFEVTRAGAAGHRAAGRDATPPRRVDGVAVAARRGRQRLDGHRRRQRQAVSRDVGALEPFYSPIYGQSGIIGYNRIRPRLNALLRFSRPTSRSAWPLASSSAWWVFESFGPSSLLGMRRLIASRTALLASAA